MQQRVYTTLFRNIKELEKRLIEVLSRTLSTLLSTHRECISLHVFRQMVNIRIFTVSNCTTGQLNKLSTKVLEIWTKC